MVAEQNARLKCEKEISHAISIDALLGRSPVEQDDKRTARTGSGGLWSF
jgi:hypothetical protein